MAPTDADKSHVAMRIVSVAAATCISLSSGTNYAYSAWAPQFAEKLSLTATQANLIGNAGNLGMYAMGIPGGILIDHKGPRYGVFAGALALAGGYFPLRWAYVHGPGSMSVGAMCFFSLLTGVGSCTAFSAGIKVCATNWPRHRGTATAFPLSAFGLSALFYTVFAGLVLPHDTAGYLLILAVGTTSMVFIGMFFLQTVHPNAHDRSGARRGLLTRKDSNPLHNRGSVYREDTDAEIVDESSSLVPSDSSEPGDLVSPQAGGKTDQLTIHSPNITGIRLLTNRKFWQLFIMLSLLSGVGLMTINNIGNDARALWRHHDKSISREFIQRCQLFHVSILSGFSFLGRLASGIGSDWLIHHHASRFWTLVVAASVFTAAQIVALSLSDPHHLFFLSGLTGLAYGGLFGVYPALVADAFGPSGMGINWGTMTIAPVVTGNVFNVVYGTVFDRHSHVSNPDGRLPSERVCDEGKACYSAAYWVTLASSLVGVAWSLWCVRAEQLEARRSQIERRQADDPDG